MINDRLSKELMNSDQGFVKKEVKRSQSSQKRHYLEMVARQEQAEYRKFCMRLEHEQMEKEQMRSVVLRKQSLSPKEEK